MRFLFVMDPLDSVTPEKDTSFAFIASAESRGHECWHSLVRDVAVASRGPGQTDPPECFALARRLKTGRDPLSIGLGVAPERFAMRDLDAVFIRKDPPFDQAYLYLTLCLEHARGGPILINDPRALRDANEKIYALQFAQWMPRTSVTADRETILAFTREAGGRAVIKPLDGAGGMGVMQLSTDDKNARAIVDLLTHEGRRLVMIQAFLPEVTEGDKRIILLDGEPLGAILRVPQGDDIRSNIHVGGTVVPAKLTAREEELCRDLAPRLRRDGLVFVGLDVIGEHLTEVNVTSPTGIQELGLHQNARPADRVIEWVESRRASRD